MNPRSLWWRIRHPLSRPPQNYWEHPISARKVRRQARKAGQRSRDGWIIDSPEHCIERQGIRFYALPIEATDAPGTYRLRIARQSELLPGEDTVYPSVEAALGEDGVVRIIDEYLANHPQCQT